MTDEVTETRNKLRHRGLSYKRVFNHESSDALMVMIDLAKFCRANESTFDPDPRVHALLEGRKEVWLRIQQHLNLSDEQLWNFFTRKAL